MIEAAVDFGVLVRPPKPGVRYVGYADAASGTGKDSYAIAVAHAEADTIVLDLAYEQRPPFNPQSATTEAAKLFRSYGGINQVRGDKFAAGFVVEAFAKNGIKYEYSDNDTSENYLNALPLFTAGRVRLIDNKRLVAQFAGLKGARRFLAVIASTMEAAIVTMIFRPQSAGLWFLRLLPSKKSRSSRRSSLGQRKRTLGIAGMARTGSPRSAAEPSCRISRTEVGDGTASDQSKPRRCTPRWLRALRRLVRRWRRTKRAGIAWRSPSKQATPTRGGRRRRWRRPQRHWRGYRQVDSRCRAGRAARDGRRGRKPTSRSSARRPRGRAQISARLAARGAALDAALDQVREGYADFQADLRELAMLGAPAPAANLIDVNSRRTLDSALGGLHSKTRPVPPLQRHSFDELCRGWARPSERWAAEILDAPAKLERAA